MPVGKRQPENKLKMFRVNKEIPEYHAGIREGRSQERGNWVKAISHIKEIDEALLGRIIGEVAKIYEGE